MYFELLLVHQFGSLFDKLPNILEVCHEVCLTNFQTGEQEATRSTSMSQFNNSIFKEIRHVLCYISAIFEDIDL